MQLRKQHQLWVTTLGLLLGASCDEGASFTQKEVATLQAPPVNTADVIRPDGGRVTIGPNGETIVTYPDGTQVITTIDGQTTVIGPNGQVIANDTARPGGDVPAGDPPGDDGGGNPPLGNDAPDSDAMRPDTLETREQVFQVAQIQDAEARHDRLANRLNTSFAMRREMLQKTLIREQITRPSISETFDQGSNGSNESELFDQIADRVLDILVVVDNSRSMREEQANLATKLSPLLAYVADANWRIAVVTTDPNESCLRGLINKGDNQAQDLFARAVTAGIQGSNNERGILTAVRALAGQCPNQADWVRPDSTLAVLVVTDEDNCSDGTGCPGKAYASSDYVLDYLKSVRVPGSNARVYGIFWHPDQTAGQCSTGYNKAVQWSQLVRQTNGTWGSICDSDYSATLLAISKNLQAVLNTKFTLRNTPDSGTVEVLVNNVVRSTGITVTGKVVELNPPPAEGAKVRINYRQGASPMRKFFPLQYKPLDGSVSVTLNGASLANSAYVIDPAGPHINFVQIPPERARITVTYKRDLPLNAQFVIGEAPRSGSVTVEVNDQAADNYQVLEPVSAIMFAVPPPEGATIRISYTVAGDPVLRYPLSAGAQAPSNLVVKDTGSDQPLAVTYNEGGITFNQQDFVEGREVMVSYDSVAPQAQLIRLAQAALPASISAEAGNQICTGVPPLVLADRDVDFAGCNFAPESSAVLVRYEFVAERRQEFEFSGPNLPAANDWQEWKVYVDDEERTDWQRSGNIIKFASPLPDEASVKVTLTQGVR